MLRSWKLIGRPRLHLTDRLDAPAADERVGQQALVRPAPVPAEGQLEDAAHHEAMRHVELRQPLFVVGVGRIQHEDLLGELSTTCRPPARCSPA